MVKVDTKKLFVEYKKKSLQFAKNAFDIVWHNTTYPKSKLNLRGENQFRRRKICCYKRSKSNKMIRKIHMLIACKMFSKVFR